MTRNLLDELRTIDLRRRASAGSDAKVDEDALLAEFAASGVAFVSTHEALETRYYDAVRELISCIKPTAGLPPILQEGGIYYGCWLESTGTINTELLCRFIPSVAQETFGAFAKLQRPDGLLPYKITANGEVFSQIQLVTPPARSVWTHYCLNGRDKTFLRTMYEALGRYDDWLAQHRDTRGTGAVEAFCTFDTGHDLSARFWHVPDSPFNNDPARYNSDNPILPFIAPDLTATVACGRAYLARMADELGEDGEPWRAKADASIAALFEQCYDEADGFFYDRDRNGRLVRVQSDVLLRVLACEVGDDAFFAQALERYLLNTAKFFAKYPFTSLALDDPRFDRDYQHNSWCGPSNFLSLIRAAHAFEAHGRHVEMTWMLYPVIAALAKSTQFPQCLDPFTGQQGFTEVYSPSILCLLDFVERLCGVQPRPDGTLWFTGLVPYQVDHRDAAHETAYSRTVDGVRFELCNTREQATAYRDGQLLFRAPKGVRVITDRPGNLRGIVGMSVNIISGVLETATGSFPFTLAANEERRFDGQAFSPLAAPGLVAPTYSAQL